MFVIVFTWVTVVVKFSVLVTAVCGEVIVAVEVTMLVFVVSSAGATTMLVERTTAVMMMAAETYAKRPNLRGDWFPIFAIHWGMLAMNLG